MKSDGELVKTLKRGRSVTHAHLLLCALLSVSTLSLIWLLLKLPLWAALLGASLSAVTACISVLKENAQLEHVKPASSSERREVAALAAKIGVKVPQVTTLVANFNTSQIHPSQRLSCSMWGEEDLTVEPTLFVGEYLQPSLTKEELQALYARELSQLHFTSKLALSAHKALRSLWLTTILTLLAAFVGLQLILLPQTASGMDVGIVALLLLLINTHAAAQHVLGVWVEQRKEILADEVAAALTEPQVVASGLVRLNRLENKVLPILRSSTYTETQKRALLKKNLQKPRSLLTITELNKMSDQKNHWLFRGPDASEQGKLAERVEKLMKKHSVKSPSVVSA